MLQVSFTGQFKKDFKLCRKRGYNMELYRVEGNELVLYRTGTHFAGFRMAVLRLMVL